MVSTEEDHSPRKRHIPRWALWPLWAVFVFLVHIGIPWAVSRIGSKWGWGSGRPSWWNIAGLGPVGVGLLLVAWALAHHRRRMPTAVELDLSPKYLLMEGPYRYTRNPMYLGALTIWAGWALFYGSMVLVVVWVSLAIILHFAVIRREERALERRFGPAYLEYKRRVPRWFRKGSATPLRSSRVATNRPQHGCGAQLWACLPATVAPCFKTTGGVVFSRANWKHEHSGRQSC